MEDNKLVPMGEENFEDLEKAVLQEQDPVKLQSYVDLFNQNLKKRDIIRAGKLSTLQDKVSTEMIDRVENHADAFSNRDLLDYFKTIQETLSKTPLQSEIKPIQLTQNQLNITVNDQELSSDSARRIKGVVDAILKKYGSQEEPQTLIVEEEREE